MYLNCHSYHSLRYGTIPLTELVELAKQNHVDALALTDINTVTGIYDFVQECERQGIKPLVGMEFRSNNQLRFIGIAKSFEGIGEMCRYLTQYNFDKAILPAFAPEFNQVVVIYPMENSPLFLRDNEYIGVRPEQQLKLIRPEWQKQLNKMVVLQPVTFRSQEEYRLHKVLRAIDENTLISKLSDCDICHDNEIMFPIDIIRKKFEEYPQILKNTEKLPQQCNFSFDFKSPKNKQCYTNDRYSDKLKLASLAEEGLVRRYGYDNQEAINRVKKELEVINDLSFNAYFLITWDIVNYSTHKGFMHVGRGSGANSIVSYCLGITDICPIELDLYFERFLNANRKSPPDFDIDWSWRDRDTMLEYMFSRFGKDHVAFCGTIAEFKYRSILREVGKAFGLPKEELDTLTRTAQESHDKNNIVRAVHKYGRMLEKYPNQRSMHSCGVLISENPITNYTALEMPPKGFPIVQFDMHIAEDIGFEKFDILSQRGLGTIHDAVQLIKENQDVDVDIRDITISKDNPECNEYLSRGQTIGCFYIESPAMRGLLRRLKCNTYKVLVAASSIIRPGVAQSGMMKEYIFRHNFPDKFQYFHEVFETYLKETYGIMVYQEDVIKVGIYFGGLHPADADILRRSISGKGRSLKELQSVKEAFFMGCTAKGHPLKLSTEVYRQIQSFAGYSFCKAHSASYAVESYQSLYLKVNFPIEFMVAAINNFGGFYRTEVYIHEARMSGAIIHNPCVNNSSQVTTIKGRDVYLGFVHLKSLDGCIGNLIASEREIHGEFKSLEDFTRRIPIGIETLQILIYVGAFRFTGKSKGELILSARLQISKNKNTLPALSLLYEAPKEYKFPKLDRHEFEDAFDEIEYLSFPVSCSPFDLLVTKYRGTVMVKDLSHYHEKVVKMLAYLISRKHVPTDRGEMFFGTWIDTEGNFFDTAHFADSLKLYPFLGGGCYLLQGKVEVDYHFPLVVVFKMAKMPFIADPRYSHSAKDQYKTQGNIKEDISMTWRAPYPKEHEIGLPRQKMAD